MRAGDSTDAPTETEREVSYVDIVLQIGIPVVRSQNCVTRDGLTDKYVSQQLSLSTR